MNQEVADVLAELAGPDAERIHLGRFIGGVVYALQQYEHLAIATPKEIQSDEFYQNEFMGLLRALQGGLAPPSNWLRGFLYNAALMRLDAAWERSLLVVLRDTSKKANGPELYKKLCQSEPTLPDYDNSIFKQVRRELNALKHKAEGPSGDIREEPAILRTGLEDLLSLVKRRVISAA